MGPRIPCHTAEEGEECYEHVMWAMTKGIQEHPENYGHLTAESTFEEFQEAIRPAHPTCPEPYLGRKSRLKHCIWKDDHTLRA